jgi:hypothetical protein
MLAKAIKIVLIFCSLCDAIHIGLFLEELKVRGAIVTVVGIFASEFKALICPQQ